MVVLVVDDDALWRALVCNALKHASTAYRPVEAGSGEAALALVSDCHLLVTDISMPGMGGIELIRQVRSRRYADTLRVVAVSTQAQFRLDALEAGADAFVEKSFLLADVKAAAAALLDLPAT